MYFLLLFDRIFGLLLGLIVAGMMLMTFIDVMLREIYEAPLIIAPELTTIGLAAMVYIGMPLVSARDDHITISLFENLFRGRAQRIKKAVVALLLAALSGVLAYQLWLHAEKLGTEVMMFLQLRKEYIAYAMSFLSGIMALTFLVRVAIELRGVSPQFEDRSDISTRDGA